MLAIDADSPVPPFEQLRQALAARIHDGTLASGSRLPTVRGLAEQLGIATNTVARTYRELESAGLVETRGRGGTVVSWSGDVAERALQQAAAAYAGRAAVLGVEPAAALRLVEQALAAGSHPVAAADL